MALFRAGHKTIDQMEAEGALPPKRVFGPGRKMTGWRYGEVEDCMDRAPRCDGKEHLP